SQRSHGTRTRQYRLVLSLEYSSGSADYADAWTHSSFAHAPCGKRTRVSSGDEDDHAVSYPKALIVLWRTAVKDIHARHSPYWNVRVMSIEPARNGGPRNRAATTERAALEIGRTVHRMRL